MKKKLLLLTMLFVLPSMNARKRIRRRGSISQALKSTEKPALQLSTESLNSIENKLKIASVDKLSTSFEDNLKEGTAAPDFSLPKSQLQLKSEAARERAPEFQHQYKIPIELQKVEEQKAKEALRGVEETAQEEEKIELQFEDADLQNFVQQISDLFNVTFISDENIDPLPQGTSTMPVKAIKGNKITFKTNKPLSRQEAWDLFITFLDIAGFAVVPHPDPTIYRIQTIKSAQRAPVPTYLGVNYEHLPDNDQIIRYLYFIENATVESMKAIVPSLISTSAGSPIFLQEHKAFIVTDKAYNIRSLMQIVKELDKVTMPQAMSVLKLRQVDALEVKKLYDELTQKGESRPFRPFGARKQPTAIYFPENARLIAEPRTNSLILLGPKDAIAKIEEFVTKYIDVELDQPYSPLHTYQLRYADAKAVADIMNSTTKFGANTEAGKSGGVRGRDKYLRQMLFTPEPTTNKLIIKGDYDDFLLAKQVLDELDKPQPQVAIEVLLLSVTLQDTKELGAVIRSKVNNNLIPGLKDLLGKNTAFQTSGLRAGGSPKGIETNNEGTGFQRLLGNLLKLVTSAPAGNTIVTFGQDLFGVWGLFQMLQSITSVEVISNPFLFASNQTPARVSLGETRRVIASTVFATQTENSFQDDSANLQVDIRPQINSDGMIVLNLEISNSIFTDREDQTSGNKQTRAIKTQAILADKEVLALGGLIRERHVEGLSKTPGLADIPVLGWLFKNRSKQIEKSSILVLLSTKIIPPFSTKEVDEFTQERIKNYDESLTEEIGNKRDPIHKLFFAEAKKPKESITDLLFERHEKSTGYAPRKKKKRRRRRKDKVKEKPIEQLPTVRVTKAPPVPVTTIAAPEIKVAQKAAAPNTIFKDKRRRSKQLSSFLSPSDQSEVV